MINGNVGFSPDVKYHTAPKVVDSFIDDEGEKVLVLANGNTTLESRYNALWNPLKGKVKPEHYKGENPDRTKIR